MVIFVPYYDRAWKVAEIDTEKTLAGRKQFRVLNTRHSGLLIEYCGSLYNGDNCYATYGDALKWIDKLNPPRLDITRIK